jgi:hypothetical protein
MLSVRVKNDLCVVCHMSLKLLLDRKSHIVACASSTTSDTPAPSHVTYNPNTSSNTTHSTSINSNNNNHVIYELVAGGADILVNDENKVICVCSC